MNLPERAYDEDWYKHTIDRIEKQEEGRRKKVREQQLKEICERCGAKGANFHIWEENRWISLCIECYRKR